MPSPSAIDFADAVVETDAGPRGALVMTPRDRIRVGRAGLEELRLHPSTGAIDQECIAEVRRRRGAVKAVIFRGVSDDGVGSWGIDETIPDSEALELATRMLRAMAATYRNLGALGVVVHVHSDFSFRDADLCQGAVDRMMDELGEAPQTALARADRWFLRHMAFYFTLPFAKVLSKVLPDKLPLLERRLPRIQSLLAALADPDRP